MASPSTVVAITADTRQFDTAMDRTARQAQKAANAVHLAWKNELRGASNVARIEAQAMESRMASLAGAMKTSFVGMGAAAAAALGVAGAGAALQMADKFNILQQRIRTATKDTGDFARVSQQLYAITQKNGAAFEDTVGVFQSLARASKELGATNNDMLKLTDIVQKLGVIGGSSAEAMKNGLLQFSQAMAGGTVHAEEMNSILENMPELANRIAKGMGLTVGELRNAVKDGKVLSTDVFKALIQQGGQINKEFEKMPPTLDRAGIALQNASGKFLSDLDQSLGITKSIASSMNDMAKSINVASANLTKFIEQWQKMPGFKVGGNQLTNGQSVGFAGDVAGQTFKQLAEAMSGGMEGYTPEQQAEHQRLLANIFAKQQYRKLNPLPGREDLASGQGIEAVHPSGGGANDKALKKALKAGSALGAAAGDAFEIPVKEVEALMKEQKAYEEINTSMAAQVQELQAIGQQQEGVAAAVKRRAEFEHKIRNLSEEHKNILRQQFELTESLNAANEHAKVIEGLKKENEEASLKLQGLEKLIPMYRLLDEEKQKGILTSEHQKEIETEYYKMLRNEGLQTVKDMGESEELENQKLMLKLQGQEELIPLLEKELKIRKMIGLTEEDKQKAIQNLEQEHLKTIALNKDLEAQNKLLDRIMQSKDGYVNQVKYLQQAQAAGLITQKQYADGMEKLALSGKKASESAQAFAKTITKGLSDAAFSGKKLTDVFKDMGNELLKMVAQKALFDPLEAGIGNFIDGLLGGAGGGTNPLSGAGGGIGGAGGLGGLLGGAVSGLGKLFGFGGGAGGGAGAGGLAGGQGTGDLGYYLNPLTGSQDLAIGNRSEKDMSGTIATISMYVGGIYKLMQQCGCSGGGPIASAGGGRGGYSGPMMNLPPMGPVGMPGYSPNYSMTGGNNGMSAMQYAGSGYGWSEGNRDPQSAYANDALKLANNAQQRANDNNILGLSTQAAGWQGVADQWKYYSGRGAYGAGAFGSGPQIMQTASSWGALANPSGDVNFVGGRAGYSLDAEYGGAAKAPMKMGSPFAAYNNGNFSTQKGGSLIYGGGGEKAPWVQAALGGMQDYQPSPQLGTNNGPRTQLPVFGVDGAPGYPTVGSAYFTSGQWGKDKRAEWGVGGWSSSMGFASGGRPPVGRPVMVGERGPELVQFGAPASITPNHELAKGGKPNLQVVVNNNAPVQVSTTQTDQGLQINVDQIADAVMGSRNFQRQMRRNGVPTRGFARG